MTASDRPMGLTDPLYLDPYVDVDEWRDEPIRHHYVHGGFTDIGCRFSMYFPEAKRYQGRFFHPVTPVPGTEHAVTAGLYAGYIEFSVASGAYLVESNLGLTRRALPGEDSTIAGYRASAAVAMYSRVLAAEMYGDHRGNARRTERRFWRQVLCNGDVVLRCSRGGTVVRFAWLTLPGAGGTGTATPSSRRRAPWLGTGGPVPSRL